MDLEDSGKHARFMIRDRDGKYPRTVRRRPRRRRHPGRPQRSPHPAHERDHGALDPQLPP
ncbi:hypothetical protein J2S66_000913 [Saccharothrix longispora]|uniref:Uncharacterized protein n=1 Tax=Saccharothrix longispora TaxID=33920 RepID=A0ABU1PRI9_9PSEU|nr:hypothetical protein [Saccharothrix longispora]